MNTIKKSFWVLLLFLVAIGYCSFGQNRQILKGVIVDSMTFKPMQSVSIQLKGTNSGTVTDAKGDFSISANNTDTLLISFVGYKSIELPLFTWEPSIIRMAEQVTILNSVIVEGGSLSKYYEYLFEEENALLRKANSTLPFYYKKDKKEKIKVQRFKNENLRVKTYIDVVSNSELKNDLMKKHKLTENEYYNILMKFNEANHSFMYYLTAPELLSLLNSFYNKYASTK